MGADPIEVRIRGAVVRMGDYPIPQPATVAAAIAAAGGLARLPRRWASGRFTIRRRLAPGEVQTWDLEFQQPAAWEGFPLLSGDLIVVQWHLVAEPGEDPNR